MFCAIVAMAYGLLRDDWVGGALSGITLAIALLPEEFPMVLAIFMALGAFRLARHKVLVRRAAVIETLGAATFLCVDKTGTLTENRMVLTTTGATARFMMLQDMAVFPAAPSRYGLPYSPLPSARWIPWTGPSMNWVARVPPEPDRAGAPLRTYPAPSRATGVHPGLAGPGGRRSVCRERSAGGHFPALSYGRWRALQSSMPWLPALRNGVCGSLAWHRGRRTGTGDGSRRTDLRVRGADCLRGPGRDRRSAGVAEAKRAGITVAMITGDYPVTALEIARQAGIDASAGVLSGREIAGLDPPRVRERVQRTRVFARIMPEQKLALVEELKAAGEIVAMTGDGVNDAPALESAHIGIAMGKRGTDVAREAADLVLLDDRFASIVGGVRLGRRIFANLRKALTYVTAIHVPIAGLALLPILLGLPPILYPMHVILLELVVDPVCSLVFEGEPSERHAMHKPPRPAERGALWREADRPWRASGRGGAW